MSKAKRITESIKTVLIVALAVSAVFLLLTYWGGFSLQQIGWFHKTVDTPVETADAPKTQEIILPQRIAVEENGDTRFFMAEEHNAWERIVDGFSAFSQVSEGSAEELPEDVYRARTAGTRLSIEFGYNLPFDGFCKQFGIASAKYGNVTSLEKLVFADGVPDGLFVEDVENGKYYQLVGTADRTEAFRALLKELKEDTAAVDRFTFFFTDEFADEDRQAAEDREEAFARSFFNGSLDFIRRIEDSKGTRTYMYGYSEKVLSISREGTAEYREELQPATISQGFYASLGVALQYTAARGGWYPTVYEEGREVMLTPVLAGAMPISENHRNGYRFLFDFRYGRDLASAQGLSPIVCEVFDGQVTYYYRKLFREAEAVRVNQGKAD